MSLAKLKEEEEFVYNVLLAEKPINKQIELYKEIASNYDESFNQTRDSRILDVGAGTGRSGKLLNLLGYKNVDALDGCEEMLHHSQKLTNVYKNFITALVVVDQELPIAENTYDVALMSGSASPAHIDVAAYKQIIRVVKPGNLNWFIIINYELLKGGIVGWIVEDSDTCEKLSSRFHNNNYIRTLQKFVDEGLWMPLDGYNPKRVPNATLLKPADIFFYKVLK
ncbi:malonyl-[acyl-carrier protein] O-methyltransferase-like protein [Leptotrombidium deliense]|uniref:Malonyl-[acyl-carrier protein] O-methyltransferase-like protein n=1 Tax=Leptotrombidium deliense TaxID=299467 RepID=A0A443SHB4_9ACAR|nr:malonyl-[acyl-carrier protein] O-methyltransferase-like protein [Leptotrombidium deliense]